MKDHRIDTEPIKAAALKDLLDVVDSVRGKKALILDPSLTGVLGLIVKFPVLRDHGLDKVFHLDARTPLSATHDKIICICRPSQANCQIVLSISLSPLLPATLTINKDYIQTSRSELREQQQPHGPKEFHVYFVPRKTSVCVDVFEQGGVLGDVILGELPLLFIPLEEDLLSLELDSCFAELYLNGDLSSITSSAQALMNLQHQFGLFTRLTGKGDKAKILVDMLLRMRQESIIDSRTRLYAIGQSQSIENLIIIDREVDFVTPLLTQLTYEGLIDEKFGIKNSKSLHFPGIPVLLPCVFNMVNSCHSFGGTRYRFNCSSSTDSTFDFKCTNCEYSKNPEASA